MKNVLSFFTAKTRRTQRRKTLKHIFYLVKKRTVYTVPLRWYQADFSKLGFYTGATILAQFLNPRVETLGYSKFDPFRVSISASAPAPKEQHLGRKKILKAPQRWTRNPAMESSSNSNAMEIESFDRIIFQKRLLRRLCLPSRNDV